MYLGTCIAPIVHTAGVPQRPSRAGGRTGDAGGCRLEEIELVGRVFVDAATKEDEEGEKESTSDENEGGDGEDGPWMGSEGYLG